MTIAVADTLKNPVVQAGVDASGNAVLMRAFGGCYAEATFTPAANSHTAGDCNGAAAEFALAAPSGCLFMITDADLMINNSAAEATSWRLYLYSATPPSAYADDAAWDMVYATDGAVELGYIDLGTAALPPKGTGSSTKVQNAGINRTVKLAGTSVFGYLVNLTTVTPAAVAHRVRLKGVPL